jgi:hypothetical protein
VCWGGMSVTNRHSSLSGDHTVTTARVAWVKNGARNGRGWVEGPVNTQRFGSQGVSET